MFDVGEEAGCDAFAAVKGLPVGPDGADAFRTGLSHNDNHGWFLRG
jgi:hypothetical protein